MKLILILLSTVALANASIFMPTQRLQRDVNHVNGNHITPDNSYLPPQEETQPTREYLPPLIEKKAEPVQPSNEYLPPEQEIATEAQPPNNEYLPPEPEVKDAEEITEPPTPSNEYLPPAPNGGEDYSEVPSEPLAKASEHPEPEPNGEDAESAAEHIEDTVELKEDGYHYKVPNEIPELAPGILPIPENMLPLEGSDEEVEGPANGESATLEEDGYHYRAIKRRF